MGEHWSWTIESIEHGTDAKTEASLYNHPDVGCKYHEGSCLKCPYKECYEVTGQRVFRKENNQGVLV